VATRNRKPTNLKAAKAGVDEVDMKILQNDILILYLSGTFLQGNNQEIIGIKGYNYY
jgi:hypothetical protein